MPKKLDVINQKDIKLADAARKQRRTEWLQITHDDQISVAERLEVPGGWIYLINGNIPIFIPYHNVDEMDYIDDYVHEKKDIPF